MSDSDTAPTRDQQIGSAIRRARLSRAVTQAEVAAALGVTRPTIAQYESGRRPITVATLLRIAEYLQLPVTALLPGDPPPAPPDVGDSRSLANHSPIERVMTLLQARPDLLPSVVALLEAILEREEQGDAQR